MCIRDRDQHVQIVDFPADGGDAPGHVERQFGVRSRAPGQQRAASGVAASPHKFADSHTPPLPMMVVRASKGHDAKVK